MLPPISKVVQRQAMVDRNFSCLDAISLIISIVGLVLLYRGNHLFSVNFTQNYNNKYAYIFGVIAVVCWSVANFLLHKQQVHIHHSIDTLFVSLFMALIIPAALLIYFSVNPTKLAYDMVQFLYFLASGVLTWVFHSCYTQVIAQDLKNSYLGIIYIYLVIAFFVDSIFYEEVLTMPQLIAFILIVIPNGMLIMLRALGLIRA